MKNYMMLDGKQIEISAETAENFRQQFAEETYSIGDRFLNTAAKGHPYKLLLARSYLGKVVLIELRNGNNYGGPTAVENVKSITAAEINQVLKNNQSFITRYWDNRKQVRV